MNLKKHYKLYKSGKLWVTAAITTLALTAGMAATSTTNASADATVTNEKVNLATSANDDGSSTTAGDPKGSAGSADHDTTGNNSQNPESQNDGNMTNSPKKNDDTKQVTDTITVTRKINYVTQDASGKQTSSSSSTQTVTFTRTQTFNKDGKVTDTGNWAAAPTNKDNNLEMPAMKVPAKKDYVVKVNDKFTDEIPALALTEDELNKLQLTKADDKNMKGSLSKPDVTVTYIPSTKKQTITPADDKDKAKVYDNSKSDDPANQQAVWKAVTRKINIVNIQGGDPTVITQTVWYNHTVTVTTTIDASGKETPAYTASAWQLADGQKAVWDSYQVPQIPGFNSLIGNKPQIIIPAQNVDVNTGDTTVNVTFYNDADDPVNSDVDLSQKGNWGYLDVQPHVDGHNGTIYVKGWNATNDSRKRNYHYIFVLDYGPNANPWGDTRNMPFREVGRVLVQNEQARPDVKAVHNVWNAGRSGFEVNVPINMAGVNPGDHLAIMMRWTSDPDGNPSTVENNVSLKGSADLYSNLFSIDYGTNVGSLDSMQVAKNKLHVSGWHASNSALGNRSHHFLILWDNNLGHEVQRIEVKDSVARPDVANVYPGLLNAAQSGYSSDFSLHGLDLSHSFTVISRYSDSATGEGSNIDYWSEPKNLIGNQSEANQANLDSVNISQAGNVHVSGWHATNVANSLETHQYLILWDATAGKQVGAMAIDTNARPDVTRAYPYFNGDKYGFDGTFTNVQLEAGHHYDLISRFSTSNDAKGNGDDGVSAYTDYWFNNAIVMSKNQQANHIDSVEKDEQGNLVINGWMAADYSQAYKNAYILLMNNATGREVTRQKIDNLTSRSDVAKAMTGIYNSGQSGISNFTFKLNADQQKALQGNSFHFILRFSDDDKNGKKDYVQQTVTGQNFNYDDLAVTKSEPAKPSDGKDNQSDKGNQQPQKPTDNQNNSNVGKKAGK